MVPPMPLKGGRKVRACLALALTLMLVTLAPFAAALEIHHALAAADHDGHEHSEFDLCQWVQEHTAHSTLAAPPALSSWVLVGRQSTPWTRFVPSTCFNVVNPPRGPPAA
jgi:hypothetical protein